MLIHCREVNVKFKDKMKNSQRIMHTEITGADTLEVEVAEGFLVVCYMRKHNEDYVPIKVICFAREDVQEFYCENTVTFL